MKPICRTPDCEHDALDGALGFCADCRRQYADRRALTAEVSAALYAQRPELFDQLTKAEAQQLAEHLLGHARMGERGFYARFWAGMDFVRETRERRVHRDLARHVLVHRRQMRGGPQSVTA